MLLLLEAMNFLVPAPVRNYEPVCYSTKTTALVGYINIRLSVF